jgi:hypothetical protein
MLEPPISQQDIDNRTLFRTRGGGTARVTAGYPDLHVWIVNYGKNAGTVTRFGSASTWSVNDYDLISRIPEPKMESQVVVEDRRTGAEDEWKCIDELTSKTIFECKGDTRHDVYLKIYGGHSICLTNKASYHDATDWLVRPLTHLRLRMILEPKPA